MRQKKHISSFLLICVSLAFLIGTPAAFARKAENTEERKNALAEMREYKHSFFKKYLDLTREQEIPFFKAYDQMDDELIKIGEETRSLENKLMKDSEASDTELESAARTIFEQKKREGEIELQYFEEFRNILTKRQLLRLKETERRFNRALLHYSRQNEMRRGDREMRENKDIRP